jgi:hypothetical protein
VRILSHRLQRAVTVLGLRRVVVVALVPILVAGVIIVRVEVFLREGERGLLKKMMNTMRRGNREKENEKGDHP